MSDESFYAPNQPPAPPRQPKPGERLYQTLRVTPAMEAGIADHVWSIEEIVGLLN